MVSNVMERPGFPRLGYQHLLLALLCGAALLLAFREGLERMVATWLDSEEYSYGFIIPAVSAYLIWQRRQELKEHWLHGSWWGVFVVLAGALLNLIGQLATVFALQQYAFIVVLCGIVVALGGWAMLRKLTAPMVMLLFMVPLPNFFTNGLSAQLQLVSSQLGVWFIRLAGVSVFLEGNVIDLGSYKLQVAEACSGLRYLFPLMTLGFIMAYFYKVEWCKRACLFLSTIPVTVGLNSLRIGIIGVTVDRFGIEAAEGLLHDLEGWVIFMVSTFVLIGEMMLLSKIGRVRRPWREVFGLHHAAVPAARVVFPNTVPRAFSACALSLVLCATTALFAPTRVDVIPARESFAGFPMRIQGWSGQRHALEPVYLDTLQLDDYVMADYREGAGTPVNFYVAWYDSQRSGQSAHSPRSCLPGGGWRITELRERVLDQVSNRGQALRVNRVIIENGGQHQVVYYWFQQRHRNLTNEYLVKWFLFWDSLWRQRSDGALIRLIAPVPKGESIDVADRRLQEFAAEIVPNLPRYIPG